MSVNRTEYIIWGIVLPYPKDRDDDWQEETLEPYRTSFYDKQSAPMNGKNDTVVILDGMSSKYMIVGHVIDRTHGHEGSFSNSPVVLPTSPGIGSSTEDIAMYAQWMSGIEATLADIGIDADGSDARWMVLHHYT